jgi:hypothetical protein
VSEIVDNLTIKWDLPITPQTYIGYTGTFNVILSIQTYIGYTGQVPVYPM